MKALLIARVSDPEQKKALPAQKQKLLDYAEREQLDYEYIEFDETAYKDTRPKFKKEVLDKLNTSNHPLVVVFDKIDRFTRDSSSDERAHLTKLFRAGRIELHFPSDNLVIHKDSPAPDLFRLDIGIALGGYYSAAIRDNVKRRFAQKLRDGEWTGPAPIGYLNQRIDEKSTTIVKDPDRAHLIHKAFEMRAEGKSFDVIANHLKNMGLRSKSKFRLPLSASRIEEMCRNPFYYGQMICKGVLYDHNYEPIVTKWLFDKVQIVNKERAYSKTKTDSTPFLFQGILKCAFCGYSVCSDRKKGKYVYLKCTQYGGKCPAVRVSEQTLTSQVEELLESIQVPKDIMQDVVRELESSHKSEQEHYQRSINRLRQRYDEIDRSIKVMYQDRLVGRITAEQYDEMVSDAKNEQADLNMQLDDHSRADESFLITASYVLELASRASSLFKQSSEVEQKRRIITLVLSNLKLEGEKLVFNLKAPFDAIAECSNNDKWLRRQGSNL